MCITLVSKYRSHGARSIAFQQRLELVNRFHLQEQSTDVKGVSPW